MPDTPPSGQNPDEQPDEEQSLPSGVLYDLLEDTLCEIEAAASNKAPHRRIFRSIPTGFADYDALTGGLSPGTLTVIASRPAMGRTTLITDICRHAAIAQGVPTAVFTLEEDQARFTARLLSAEARVPKHHLEAGRMTEDGWNRLAKRMPEIANCPLYVKAPHSLTMAELAEEAAELVKKYGVELLALDGIQDVKPEKRSDLREREVGDVARGLKTLARQLDIPVVATSHLNRNPEQRLDRKPKLDDLRESGAITFAADTIVLLHRDDYYELDSPRAGEADLYVAKHRHGPTVCLTVAFQSHYGRFVDMAGPV